MSAYINLKKTSTEVGTSTVQAPPSKLLRNFDRAGRGNMCEVAGILFARRGAPGAHVPLAVAAAQAAVAGSRTYTAIEGKRESTHVLTHVLSTGPGPRLLSTPPPASQARSTGP